MASTTIVASTSKESFLMDTLPIIDLRLLSQSELYSLSRCSSSSSSTSQSNNDDDVLIPKIDRSVFNESAGSRKQTYSRLRLAPRKPQFSSTSTSSINAVRHQSPERLDVESTQIITLFKQLFVAESHSTNDNYGDEDEDLVLIDHIYDESVPDSSYAVFQSIPVDIIDSSYAPIKRKRGRPRKDNNRFTQSNGNAGPTSNSGCENRAEDEEIVMIHSKKRNMLEQKHLNDLVYVKYNQALKECYDQKDRLDLISLDTIDDSNEWVTTLIKEDVEAKLELVFDDGDLTWRDVACASGAGESTKYIRSTTDTSKGKSLDIDSNPRVRGQTHHSQLVHNVDDDDNRCEEEMNVGYNEENVQRQGRSPDDALNVEEDDDDDEFGF